VQITDEPKDLEAEGYHHIVRFDLEEWKRFHKQEICHRADILDVGYWTKDGIYVPAAADHRDKISTGAHGIICNESVARLLKPSTQAPHPV
jgi:hypothetical protein